MNLLEDLKRNGLNIKLLTTADLVELGKFIDLFQDFFLLCEGEVGSAKGILKACPPTKNIEKDKFVLGVYEDDNLIAVIDLIQNYPQEKVWTIGYLLIHPNERSKGKGSLLVNILGGALKSHSVEKLRCVVQDQNTQALRFWEKSDFVVVKTEKQSPQRGREENLILEKRL